MWGFESLANQSNVRGWISDFLCLVDDHITPIVVCPDLLVSPDVFERCHKCVGSAAKGRRIPRFQIFFVDNFIQPILSRMFQPPCGFHQLLGRNLSLSRVVQETLVLGRWHRCVPRLMDEHASHSGRPLCHFFQPVLKHGRRAYDENRFEFATCGHATQEGRHLDRLAQSHFVAENSSALLAMEFPHPAQPRSLVRKESIVDPCREDQSSLAFFFPWRHFVCVALFHVWHLGESVFDPVVDSVLVVVLVPIVQWSRSGGRGG
mmetsp:Transcript_6340/g.18074  ORF Transcript_6340/g.18074 Transcript_6340/m.18074 type:complete len:262 (-) Transcript_6340:781-1566(-)